MARRAAEALPEARILAVLRHPAERAASHFAWRRARGHEPLASLEEALADAVEDLLGRPTGWAR